MSDRRPPTTLEARLSLAAIGCVMLALVMVVAGIWADWRWAATAGVMLVAACLLAAANYTVGKMIDDRVRRLDTPIGTVEDVHEDDAGLHAHFRLHGDVDPPTSGE